MSSTRAPASGTPTASGTDPETLAGLRRWNLGLTVLHAAQAVLVLILAGDFAITVVEAFPEGPPGTPPPAPEALFDVRIGFAVAAFLLLAAVDHGLTATVARARYERDLRAGVNVFRWVEYAFSATLMLLLIAFYNGIVEVSALIAIIGANVAMILCGWIQEVVNPPGQPTRTMLPFWVGTVAGLAPWVAITVNLVGAAEVPGFVLGIFVSLFVFFSSFGLNQWLQYKGVGRWASYGYGEKVYLVLSLVAKSALAWQIFGGSLAG